MAGPGRRQRANMTSAIRASRIVASVDGYLSAYLAASRLAPPLVEAIRYGLLGGGKRLRPMLAWYACEACGGRGRMSLPAGGAVELVHAFSLVHDDLPAMDNDELRRGRPTLHVHAGEAMAILAGDAMLTLAFELLARRVRSAVLQAALTRELSRATARMIEGQVFDTLGGVPAGRDRRAGLERMHRAKTGALIEAACRMGALVALGGRQNDGRLRAVARYGRAVGLMYQVVDDLIDAQHSAQEAGKRTGKDAQAGKLTYPGLLGLAESRRQVARLARQAVAALDPLGERAEPMRELCGLIAARSRPGSDRVG